MDTLDVRGLSDDRSNSMATESQMETHKMTSVILTKSEIKQKLLKHQDSLREYSVK